MQLNVVAGSVAIIPIGPNVTDPDGDPLHITSLGQPAHGVVHIDAEGTPDDPTDDVFLYTATPGYSGSDSFTFTVTDAAGAEASATVNVTVTAALVPVLEFSLAAYSVGKARALPRSW